MKTKDILKTYFSDYKLLENVLKEAVSKNAIDSNNPFYNPNNPFDNVISLKNAIGQFGKSRIYNFDSDFIESTLDELEEVGSIFDTAKEMAEFFDDEKYTLTTINLPSKVMYVSFDKVLEVPISTLKTESVQHLTGYLISDYIVIEFALDPVDGRRMMWIPYFNGVWVTDKTATYQFDLISSRIILKIIETINSYQSVIIDNRTDKTFNLAGEMYNKKRKIKTPSEYYQVKLCNTFTEIKDHDDQFIKAEKSYAYDVRGHWAYRILTGTLPIDDTTEKYLRRDIRRQIFLSRSEIDIDNQKVLHDRRINISDNEWVSILKFWIKPYIANSKDGKNTYIPSIYTT